MGLFDAVPADADVMVLTINFADYVDGDRLSTLARQYHAAANAAPAGTDEDGNPLPAPAPVSLADFYAAILFGKLKDKLKADVRAQTMQTAVPALMAQMEAQVAAIEGAALVRGVP